VPARSYNINLTSTDDEIVGQPLTLICNVTTVRGITSRVDIVWSRNGLHLKKINGIAISVLGQNYTVYSATYTIPLLSTADDGTVYQCEVVINTSPPVMATDSVTLHVIGLFGVFGKT